MKRNPSICTIMPKIGNLVVVVITLKTNPLNLFKASMPNPVPYLNQTSIFECFLDLRTNITQICV